MTNEPVLRGSISMFDIQVLRRRDEQRFSEHVLASISAYYRRVTTAAWPEQNPCAGGNERGPRARV